MKTLAELLAVYTACHRHPVNRALHFLGVPAIVWSMMLALDHVELLAVDGLPVTLAMVASGALLLAYLALDFAMGVAATALFTLLLAAAIRLNDAVATSTGLTVALVVFVLSWMVQFLGHGVWEKRRPAIADDVVQALVAPLFLIAETAFAMGMRTELQEEVRAAPTA